MQVPGHESLPRRRCEIDKRGGSEGKRGKWRNLSWNKGGKMKAAAERGGQERKPFDYKLSEIGS